MEMMKWRYTVLLWSRPCCCCWWWIRLRADGCGTGEHDVLWARYGAHQVRHNRLPSASLPLVQRRRQDRSNLCAI